MKFSSILFTFAALSFSCHGFAVDKSLKGEVKIDGSSTVFPLAEAAAEEFQRSYPIIRVTVGLSGTGGGMKKFAAGEIDIVNASRKMKSEEIKKAQANKIDFAELPLAMDGITVAVNPTNKWATQLTLAQLKELWMPGSKIKTWKDLNPSWPNESIKLYGPGADSGTFDFFTELVMGTARLSRSDYVASEDDNVLVTGVSRDKNALAYFGYSYYIENKKMLNAVALAKDKTFVIPDSKSIDDGTYPLSRPLIVYVNSKAAKRPEVKTFIEFWLKKAGQLAKEVGYIPLKDQAYSDALQKFQAVSGTKP